MSLRETERLSGLRAVRKVVTPSESLRGLLQCAHSLAADLEPVAGQLDPLVYAADGLRVTLYERRLRAGTKANELVSKVHDRMNSPSIMTYRKVQKPSGRVVSTGKRRPNPLPEALQDVENLYAQSDGPLLVRANKIVVVTNTSDRRVASELALIIDEGSGASVLQAQQDLLYDAESRMVAGRKLQKLAGTAIQALAMPFMRLPPMPVAYQQDLVEQLAAELPVHNIEIGPIEWKYNTVVQPSHSSL